MDGRSLKILSASANQRRRVRYRATLKRSLTTRPFANAHITGTRVWHTCLIIWQLTPDARASARSLGRYLDWLHLCFSTDKSNETSPPWGASFHSYTPSGHKADERGLA
jgi:hypothetical protein